MDDTVELLTRLRREQIRLLARNVPALVFGTLMLGSGAVGLLWINQQPRHLIVGWGVTLALLSLWRLWAARRFWQRTEAGESPLAWIPLFIVASALAGLCWGSLAWFFFTPEQPLVLAVVSIMITAILSSATQSLGPYFPAHVAFAIPCALPFVLRCVGSGQTTLVTLGVLALLFLVMAELFSLRIARAIEEALRLRFENEALAGALRVEKDRAEAASQAKTRFLATASHDLRQPIHALALYVPALQGLAQLPRERLEPGTLGNIAARMQTALQTMNQLLGRLLDVSRLDAGAVSVTAKAVALAPMFNAVIDQVSENARSKGLRVRVHEPGLWVQTDAAVLHTILSNLMSNAVRYTQRGGVLLSARRRGAQVLLQVWDSGIGIAPDEQARITEEFFQARNAHEDASQARGFGLGLAIVNRSVLLLGAQLRWRSVLGRGSVFEITLAGAEPVAAVAPARPPAQAVPPSTLRSPSPPQVQAPSPAPQLPPTTAAQARPVVPASPPQAPPDAGSGPAVLVVDEDDDILASMTFLLRTWGYQALPAHSLIEAREVVLAQNLRLHAALVDFHLASQENGLAVAAMLRELVGASLPVAIVTGDTTPEVMAAVRGARLELLHKPAAAEAVQAFIATARATH